MSNNYFDPNANPISANSLAKSDHINSLRDELAVSFDKLPEYTDLAKGSTTYGVDTGVVNAYAVALPVTATTYTVGMTVSFIPVNTNTLASTVNIDSIGAKAIKKQDGTDVIAGDLVAGQIVSLVYDGTVFRFATAVPQSLADDITTKHDTVVAKEALVNPHYTAIDAVYANEINVNKVAAVDTDVSAVALIDTDVTKVAAITAGDVTKVANIDTDVTTVAGITVGDISKVAAVDTDVSAVALIDSDVTTVAGITAGDISKVAAVDADVSAVALIDSNVTTVAGIHAEVSTVATNVVDVTNFADVYYGPSATAPTLRKDTSPLQSGDLYFNTVSKLMQVYDGTIWKDAYLPDGSYITRTEAETLVNNVRFSFDLSSFGGF